MIHFITKLNKVREDALDYIKEKLMQERLFLLDGYELYHDLEHHTEAQLIYIENNDGEYIVHTEGILSKMDGDVCDIDDLSTENICAIADIIHLDNTKLKYDLPNNKRRKTS